MNFMEKDLNFNHIKDEMEKKKAKQEADSITKVKDMPLTVRFTFAAKQLGIARWNITRVNSMVEAYKQDQASGPKVDERKSIAAAIWWGAKESSIFDKAKIVKTIKKTIAYDPADEARGMVFIYQNPKVAFALFMLLMLAIDTVFYNVFVAISRIEWLTFILIVAAVFTNVRMFFNYISIMTALED